MPTPLRVLLVEDSEDDALLIVRELRHGGYDVVFERVDSQDSMGKAVARQPWDLVISDYSMPHFSGTDALRLLRKSGSDAPFIFVSGTIGEETAVAALKMGAQDYVMKGNLKRLLPAIERELHEIQRQRERKVMQERLTQLERFEAIGRLAGGIAHDFNNVIGVILGWAELGLDEAPAGTKLRDLLIKIADQSKRAGGITGQLLAFARRQVLQPQNLDLNALILKMKDFLRSAIGENVELKTVLAHDLRVIRADPTQIEQVLLNLCLNARDAMPRGGRLVVETQNLSVDGELSRVLPHSKPGEYVLLVVADSGEGMDEETLKRIFEPFFTTKELGRGTGLGLSTVYGIVKQHEGYINAYSELGQGTTFRVYFPASSGNVAAVGALPKEASTGSEKILVAEDNEGLREIASIMLSDAGYTVFLAADGRDALRLFKENLNTLDLVMLDMVMPSMSGSEVAATIHALRPDIPVIFTTGHSRESAAVNSHVESGSVFLQKPYDRQALLKAVRAALNK